MAQISDAVGGSPVGVLLLLALGLVLLAALVAFLVWLALRRGRDRDEVDEPGRPRPPTSL